MHRRPFPRHAANMHQTLSSDVESHDSPTPAPLSSFPLNHFTELTHHDKPPLPEYTYDHIPHDRDCDPLSWFSSPDDPSPYCYDSYCHDFLTPTDTFSHDPYHLTNSSSSTEFYTFDNLSLSSAPLDQTDSPSPFL